MAGVWTRNYTNLLACFFAGPQNTSYTAGTAEYASNNLACRDITGTYRKIYNNVYEPYYGNGVIVYAGGGTTARLPFSMALYSPSNDATASSLYFGLGNGSHSADLYEQHTLNSWITSGLSMPTTQPPFTVEYDATNHKYTKTASFGISNVSDSNKNISELGIFTNVFDTSSRKPCMIYYDTFETITLEPYESVVITLSQSFPLINYEPYPVT